MTINEIQDEIVEEFSISDDWFDRYAMLIDIGENLKPLSEEKKKPENLIEGCQSRVWISAGMDNGNVVFEGDSDALIVKGILALLIKILSGHTPQEILSADLYSIDKIGMREHLSPTRSNGLSSMIKVMMAYAAAYAGTDKNQ